MRKDEQMLEGCFLAALAIAIMGVIFWLFPTGPIPVVALVLFVVGCVVLLFVTADP
jgi:predicted membrane channel-forming protein YqfA (hemolysin III family)